MKKKIGRRGGEPLFEDKNGNLFRECCSCGEILPLSKEFFWKQKTQKCGFRSRCKVCLGCKGKQQWGVVNKPAKELQRARMKEWKSNQKAGIYKITCTSNGKIYIGESLCLPMRWVQHKSNLRNNSNRANQDLLKDWNNFGEDQFTFEILEEGEKNKATLLEREHYYMQKLQSEGYKLYNIA
jgi:hypothetical protein